MIYLLDTNVWITVLRQPTSSLAVRFHAIVPDDVRICSVVVAELHHGCLRSAKPAANRVAVNALLAPYTSLSFDDAAVIRFATIRHALELAGQVIGPYDVQIAAVVQSNPGANYTANLAYTSAQIQPSLGRPLSGGTTVTIPLAKPYSLYGPRINQLDIRGTKIFRLGEQRIQRLLNQA